MSALHPTAAGAIAKSGGTRFLESHLPKDEGGPSEPVSHDEPALRRPIEIIRDNLNQLKDFFERHLEPITRKKRIVSIFSKEMPPLDPTFFEMKEIQFKILSMILKDLVEDLQPGEIQALQRAKADQTLLIAPQDISYLAHWYSISSNLNLLPEVIAAELRSYAQRIPIAVHFIENLPYNDEGIEKVFRDLFNELAIKKEFKIIFSTVQEMIPLPPDVDKSPLRLWKEDYIRKTIKGVPDERARARLDNLVQAIWRLIDSKRYISCAVNLIDEIESPALSALLQLEMTPLLGEAQRGTFFSDISQLTSEDLTDVEFCLIHLESRVLQGELGELTESWNSSWDDEIMTAIVYLLAVGEDEKNIAMVAKKLKDERKNPIFGSVAYKCLLQDMSASLLIEKVTDEQAKYRLIYKETARLQQHSQFKAARRWIDLVIQNDKLDLDNPEVWELIYAQLPHLDRAEALPIFRVAYAIASKKPTPEGQSEYLEILLGHLQSAKQSDLALLTAQSIPLLSRRLAALTKMAIEKGRGDKALFYLSFIFHELSKVKSEKTRNEERDKIEAQLKNADLAALLKVFRS